MAIFTHVTLGTNNFDVAINFYDAVLGALSINNLASRIIHLGSNLYVNTAQFKSLI